MRLSATTRAREVKTLSVIHELKAATDGDHDELPMFTLVEFKFDVHPKQYTHLYTEN